MKRNTLRRGLLLICFACIFTLTCFAQRQDSPLTFHRFIPLITVYPLPQDEPKEVAQASEIKVSGPQGGLRDQLYWIVGLTALSCMGLYMLFKMRK